MGRRLLRYGAISIAALVVLTIGALAYRSLQVPYQAPTVASPLPAAGGCTPAPCADLRGYTLWVSNLDVKPDLVTMQITFRNASNSSHAAPEDLVLIDGERQMLPAVFDATSCTSWSRHEFGHGATYGPVTMCFRAATIAPPLVLRWSPDFGLVCCQTDIKLT
jgi:hypothetical protein